MPVCEQLLKRITTLATKMQFVYVPVITLLLLAIPSFDAAEEKVCKPCPDQFNALMKTAQDMIKGQLQDGQMILESTPESDLSPCELIRITNAETIELGAKPPCSMQKSPDNADVFQQFFCIKLTKPVIECVNSNTLNFVTNIGRCAGVNMIDLMCEAPGMKDNAFCAGKNAAKKVGEGFKKVTDIAGKIPVKRNADGSKQELFFKLAYDSLTVCINTTLDWAKPETTVDNCQIEEGSAFGASFTAGGNVVVGSLANILTNNLIITGKLLGVLIKYVVAFIVKIAAEKSKGAANAMEILNCGD